jgi:hypothetical protein
VDYLYDWMFWDFMWKWIISATFFCKDINNCGHVIAHVVVCEIFIIFKLLCFECTWTLEFYTVSILLNCICILYSLQLWLWLCLRMLKLTCPIEGKKLGVCQSLDCVLFLWVSCIGWLIMDYFIFQLTSQKYARKASSANSLRLSPPKVS